MKYYRLTVSIIILIAFAGQMLLGDGMWSYTIQSRTIEAIGYCVNKDFQSKSKIDFNSSKTFDTGCIISVSSLFVTKEFSWEPLKTMHSREMIVSYQHIQEQLYVDKLIEPPRA